MPKMALSDAGLRSLEPPANGQLDYWDTALPGFGVRLSQGGSKTFVVNLDKSRRTIGRYPLISLSEARTEAKRMFAERTLGRIRPQSITYEQAVQVFLEEKGTRRRARTVKDHKRHLTLLAYKSQLADITHQDLERKLKRLPPSEFNHRLACAKTFFRWAQRKRYRPDDPTIGLSPHTVHSRARVLSDAELQLIWRACEENRVTCEGKNSPAASLTAEVTGPRPLPAHFATITKLLILTGQRRGEIAALRTDYFKPISKDTFPDETPQRTPQLICTLPATITKNGREHTFPISALAADIISSCTTTSPGTLFFPARGKSHAPFNGWSKSKAALDKLSGVSDWTLHDLRRTFSTRISEMGTPPHVVERLLNHVSGQISGVAAIYNRAAYLEEMREAVKTWEHHVQNKIACCTA